jgi:hypothetical protein
MNWSHIFTGLVVCMLIQSTTTPTVFASDDSPVYQMRVYQPQAGQQAAALQLITEGIPLCEKHGIKVPAVMVPVEATDERIFLLFSHLSKATAEVNWEAFHKDQDWVAATSKANTNGPIVTLLGNYYLTGNDYMPELGPSSSKPRIFELRTYIASTNHLSNLNSRFRDHTVKLFKKHGMTNMLYTSLATGESATCGPMLKALAAVGQDSAEIDATEPAQDKTLIYLLAHDSVDAAKESFGKFRTDPEWTTAMKASETKAGGPLTVKNGVKSLFLKAADCSHLK